MLVNLLNKAEKDGQQSEPNGCEVRRIYCTVGQDETQVAFISPNQHNAIKAKSASKK